jgi:signal transduction histidine kinase
MQATQSSTAWDSGSCSGQFAALRHVTRTMKLGGDVALVEREQVSVAAMGGIAEGAGLAHDAGNLLGALSLYSDLLALPGVLHEEHRAYAAELRLLSDRSWAMINRLVNHAREEQSSRIETQVTVLPEVVERCRGLLSKVAGQTVEVLYGTGAYEPVLVPAESVERILTNLVKNAAEATPWVGAITVSVVGVGERDGVRGRVVLTVRDRGCGMDAPTAQGLMQAGGISPSCGRGLGFRVVRELVAMSGGCLTIESELDVGTSISAEWYALEDFEERSFEEPSFEKQGRNVVMQRDVRSIAC